MPRRKETAVYRQAAGERGSTLLGNDLKGAGGRELRQQSMEDLLSKPFSCARHFGYPHCASPLPCNGDTKYHVLFPPLRGPAL